MKVVAPSGRVFAAYCDFIDATSISRPDPSWHMVDAHGHEHRWYIDGAPATAYSPQARYEVPTLRRVVDGSYIDEWGDEHEDAHLECVQCGEHIHPGTTADTTQQLIPGLRRYSIDGRSVTEDVFRREMRAEGWQI